MTLPIPQLSLATGESSSDGENARQLREHLLIRYPMIMPKGTLIYLLPAILVSCSKHEAPTTPEPSQPNTRPSLVERAVLESSGRGEDDEDPEPTLPPGEALAAALRLESPVAREKALAEVAWNTMETDPELAHSAFAHLPAGSPEKIRLIRHYAMTMAEANPEAALEWAAARLTPEEMAAARGQVALAIAERDPAQAATLAAESGLAGRDLDVVVVQVVQRWAAKSPPDAAAWILLFPQGPARESGVRHLAEIWLPRDAGAAFTWLGGLSDTTFRAQAARGMQGVLLQQDKETRASWLNRASTEVRSELEAQREAALQDVGDNVPQGEE